MLPTVSVATLIVAELAPLIPGVNVTVKLAVPPPAGIDGMTNGSPVIAKSGLLLLTATLVAADPPRLVIVYVIATAGVPTQVVPWLALPVITSCGPSGCGTSSPVSISMIAEPGKPSKAIF